MMENTTTARVLAIVYVFCGICLLTRVQAAGAASNTSNAADSSTKLKDYDDLSDNERNGVITLQFVASNSSVVDAIASKVPQAIVKVLNKEDVAAAKVVIAATVATSISEQTTGDTQDDVTSSPAAADRRRREAADDSTPGRYSEDGVQSVNVQPAVRLGKLRLAVFVQDKDGNVLAGEKLKNNLEANKEDISKEVGQDVQSVYVGLPGDMVDEPVSGRPTVWDQHRRMFIGVLILIAVAIVVLLICCLCFYCLRRKKYIVAKGKPEQSKKPLVDEEMVELTPVVPLHSAPAQSNPPTDNGQQPTAADDVPPPAEDENGWIVPIDQLSADELDQPADAPVSKL